MFGSLRRPVTLAMDCAGLNMRLHRVTARRFFVRLAGDWTCACGFLNFASRAVCFQCHRSRLVTQDPTQKVRPLVGAEHVGFKNGDWLCSCGAHNFAKRGSCLSCAAPRPEGSGRPVRNRRLLPGDWLCEKCDGHNFRGRTECLQCGWKFVVTPTASAPTAAVAAGESGSANSGADVKQLPWTCLTCHTVNGDHATTCEVCGTSHVTPAVSSSPAARPDDWQCGQCGFLNFASRAKCKNCKGACASMGGTGDPSLWICECGYKNFRDRETCRDCGASKSVKE